MKLTTADMVQTGAILVSALGLLYQLRRGWLLHSAEMVTRFFEQFTTQDFEKRRKSFAALLERVPAGEQISLADGYISGVLGFYELVAHLVRRGALDEMMVWTKFAWELVCYFHCLEISGALKAERDKNGDPSLYEDMEWLNGRLVKIYLRKRIALYKDGSIRWLEDFFRQEAGLGSYAGASNERATERARQSPPDSPVGCGGCEL